MLLSGVVIKELPAGADEDEEEEEEEEEKAAPPARGKPNAADASKNFLPLDAKKRPAAAPAATPPAKKAAPAPAALPAAAAKPAPSPAGAANGKLGSQFSDGPAGTLGARKFDNGRTRPLDCHHCLMLPALTRPPIHSASAVEIINLAAGKPDGKVALMGKRCVPAAARQMHCSLALLTRCCACARRASPRPQRADEVCGAPQVQRQGV